MSQINGKSMLLYKMNVSCWKQRTEKGRSKLEVNFVYACTMLATTTLSESRRSYLN